MKTKIVEVTNGNLNWGKFLLGRFDSEWEYVSTINRTEWLLRARGWTPEHLLVVDLQTGEGAIFRPGGLAAADLEKHKIWVCPMYQPFLEWLYKQDLSDLDKLPGMVDLKDAEFQMYGHRRPGPAAGMVKGDPDLVKDMPLAAVPASGKNDMVQDRCARCKALILKSAGDKRLHVCVRCMVADLESRTSA